MKHLPELLPRLTGSEQFPLTSQVMVSTSNLIADPTRFLPNMAATADIIVDTATDALYVPSAALSHSKWINLRQNFS